MVIGKIAGPVQTVPGRETGPRCMFRLLWGGLEVNEHKKWHSFWRLIRYTLGGLRFSRTLQGGYDGY